MGGRHRGGTFWSAMKGRKNHGVRYGIYLQRRAKYQRIGLRPGKVHHYKKWQGGGIAKHVNRNFPWHFQATGARQRKTDERRHKPTFGRGHYPFGPGVYLDIFAWPQQRGVTVKFTAPFWPHKRHTSINGPGSPPFFARPCKWRGKKLDKMDGSKRKNWLAYRYWRARGGPGGGVWPIWDPQHRTPIG